MKYKNWIIGALLVAAGALTSNTVLVAQGVGAIIAKPGHMEERL